MDDLNNPHETTLRPAPDMSLETFVAKAKDLLDEMLTDYVGSSGDEESHDWDFWTEQLTAAYVND